MPLWDIDYFESKALEKQQTGEGLPSPALSSWKRMQGPSVEHKERDVLKTRAHIAGV